MDGASEFEDHIRVPVEHPKEMNISWEEVESRLQYDDFSVDYPQMFWDAFGENTITQDLAVKAIAQFIRTMISSDSKFDKYREAVLNEQEAMGYQLFLREGGDPEVTPGGEFEQIASTAMVKLGFSFQIIYFTTTA